MHGPGPTTRISRSLTNEIIRTGNHPVAVMLENMTFWHTQATKLRDVLDQMLKHPKSAGERDRILSLLEMYAPARERAEQCAKDLAPYVHPKLASIEVIPEAGDRPLSDVPDDALAEIAALGMALVKRRQSKTVKGGD